MNGGWKGLGCFTPGSCTGGNPWVDAPAVQVCPGGLRCAQGSTRYRTEEDKLRARLGEAPR